MVPVMSAYLKTLAARFERATEAYVLARLHAILEDRAAGKAPVVTRLSTSDQLNADAWPRSRREVAALRRYLKVAQRGSRSNSALNQLRQCAQGVIALSDRIEEIHRSGPHRVRP